MTARSRTSRRAKLADPDTEVREVAAGGLAAGVITGRWSPSLFGEFTVIVVNDLQDSPDDVAAELTSLLADPPDNVALVLVHPGGVKGKALLDRARKAGAVVVEAKQIKWESDKVHFAQSEFAAGHRKITADAAAALVDAVGSDLRDSPTPRPARLGRGGRRSTGPSSSAITPDGSRSPGSRWPTPPSRVAPRRPSGSCGTPGNQRGPRAGQRGAGGRAAQYRAGPAARRALYQPMTWRATSASHRSR